MRLCCFLILMALISAAVANDFAGSATCAGCHAEAYEAWRGSHHDLAMQHADDSTVLGDFDDAEFSYGDTKTTFFRRDGGHYVRTDGPDGKLTEFPVEYTFGVAPLQQYLIPFPDGRLQALSIAWDSRPAADGGQRWFHLYPDEQVDHRHELHWSGPQQNWNFMCASCHSTNLDKGFDTGVDAATGTFDTTFSEINVGCEACHGPGSGHLRWASLDPAKRAVSEHKGFAGFQLDRVTVWPIDPATGSAKPQPRSGGHQVEVCADCHSRRAEIAPGHERSPHYFDHFMPAFLTEGLYYADGQIDDEVFEWGSFVQSRMHEAGVVCSNCHEPHSLQLRAPGDAVCAQCHLPQRFATPTHHHHEQDGDGARCVGCHMPTKTYMVVDPRHDHSLRIPRPDQSLAFGTPNACSDCHTDRSLDWAAAAFAKWYPDAQPAREIWTEAFTTARAGNPAAEQPLVKIATDADMPAIVRGTAVLELRPFLSSASIDVVPEALNDKDPLLRLAGLRSMEALPPAQRLPLAEGLLDDPLLAVRSEAGRVLAGVSPQTLSASQSERLQRAVHEYIATLKHNADRADANTRLGDLFATQGKTEQAEAAYRQAMERDPAYVPAYANLADLLRFTGRDAEAAVVLERGLARLPEAAALHHTQGLLQVRGGDTEAAVASLESAARLAPENARFVYVYAIALNSTGERTQALQALRDAAEWHPFDRDILLALVTLHAEAGAVDSARQHLKRLLEVWPNDAQAQQLARSLGPPP
ncbi:MAG: tetratricopeptide repeat protein [Gammaproteobacteria bacterium]|nr:tetratricopeptide repeat protein [Gammaproteobacteria bacterium]